MTAAFHPDPIGPARRAMPAPADTLSQLCAVRLVDRRTGRTHRINGRPLVLFTKAPDLAVADLLCGRDASLWEARIEPVGASHPLSGGRE